MFVYLRSVPGEHHFDGIRTSDAVWGEAFNWCVDTFGRQEAGGPQRWVAGNFRILIYGDRDALQFRLRWC